MLSIKKKSYFSEVPGPVEINQMIYFCTNHASALVELRAQYPDHWASEMCNVDSKLKCLATTSHHTRGQGDAVL